jgi:hypothetical protein
LARLERLESRAMPPIKLRFWDLRQLPQSYVGESHVVITKDLPPQGDQICSEVCVGEEGDNQ